MWTRTELKEKAKLAMAKPNYWISVLAGVVLSIFAGGAGGRSGASSSKSYSSDGGFSGVWVMATIFAVLLAVTIAIVLKVIVGNALIIGAHKIFLDNELDPDPRAYSKIVFVFSHGYWKNVAITMFLKDLFVALWSLLLIVPGIIKAYEYKMVPYLLVENPEMPYQDALARSKEMMDGQKWNAFVLDLSFLGWFILEALTLGVLGLFYVNPYYYQTQAELYLALKNN